MQEASTFLDLYNSSNDSKEHFDKQTVQNQELEHSNHMNSIIDQMEQILKTKLDSKDQSKNQFSWNSQISTLSNYSSQSHEQIFCIEKLFNFSDLQKQKDIQKLSQEPLIKESESNILQDESNSEENIKKQNLINEPDHAQIQKLLDIIHNNSQSSTQLKVKKKSKNISFKNYLGNLSELENDIGTLQIQRLINNEKSLYQIDICKKIAINFKLTGQYSQSISYLNQGKLIAEHFKDFQKKIQINFIITQVLIQKGDNQQALKLSNQNQHVILQILGQKSEKYANIMHSKGRAYSYLGNKLKSLQHLQKTLQIQKQTENFNQQMQDTLNDLIINLSQQNRLHEVRNKLNQLESLRKKLREKHIPINLSTLADTYSHMGTYCQSLQNYQAALQAYKKCLKLRKKYFGPFHQKVAVSLKFVGEAYMKLKMYQPSLKYLLQSKNLMESLEQKSGFKYGIILMRLGEIYFQLKQYNISEQYFLESKTNFGTNCTHMQNIEFHLGNIYKILKMYKQSLNCFQECLKYQKNIESHQIMNQIIELEALLS